VVYSSALTDFIFVVAASGSMENVPNTRSGVAHFLPESEEECWSGVRDLLSYLPPSNQEQPPLRVSEDDPERADAELQTIVPENPDLGYDMREVVTRVLDGGRLFEVQRFFARNVVTGFGRLAGHPVGVVANQPEVLAGAIDADASVKAARFIRFCDAFNVPIVSLVDVPGLAASSLESGGIVPDGGKLLYAYAEATVAKLTVITGKDHGDAYLMMSPKQLGADLNLAWPTAEIAVTAAERGYVDDVIEPRETRRELIRGLELCLRKQVERAPRKHGNIPL
jgi:propionyl-CoA carboxylase beta chain